MKKKALRARARRVPIAVLLLAACCSLSHDRQGPGGDDDSVTIQGHLTAATTPEEALTGRIRVPSTLPDFTSGVSTVGQPGVGHDGSASYRIPLWVPDGVAGLQPSLAIEYSSDGGIGLLGPRWRLIGLSAITRCPMTLAQDAVQAPVDFSGNTFCMDGQRLVIVASSGASMEFRTETDTFTKIVGTSDASGFVSFKAYLRDGRIFSYGRTLASRLHGNPIQFRTGSTGPDVSYAYYVDKIEDRYGNSILITYANAVSTSSTGMSQVQELEPSRIVWGGSGESEGRRSVTFEYDQSSIPAGSTVDTKHMRWVRGLGIGAAQYLTAINVYGPDGLGHVIRLKQYTFDYSANPATRTGTPLITGDQVLTTITEGDPDNRAWKKSTRIEWEAGSLAYTKKSFDVPDISLSYVGPPTQNGTQTNYWNQYRRMMAVDLNRDGRDDIVYRTYVTPHHSGYYDCLSWKVRTAQFTSGDTSGIPNLSGANSLTALGSDPDTSCRAYLISSSEYQNAKGPNAYAGDIVFADLNGDGYQDIVSPIGKGGYDSGANKQYSYVAGYRAYLGAPKLVFGNPINFLDSVGQPPSIGNFSTPKDATIAISFNWGDGLPEVITRGPPTARPRFNSVKLDGRGLVSKTETRGGQNFPYLECPPLSACYQPVADGQFSDGTAATEDLSTIDLDGDGVTEILLNAPSCPSGMNCGSMNGAALVRSPTMSGTMPLPRGSDSRGNDTRWFLDLNGDGLLDIAWGGSVDDAALFAAINTGAGFGPTVSTQLPVGVRLPRYDGRRSGQVLIADFNLDGRQDLIFSAYSTKTVLLSDGGGGVSVLSTTEPDGVSDQFVQHNLAADLNGDGLPDFVNIEDTETTPPTVVGHIRQGQAPMMVTKVTEGTGRTIEFGYDVVSGRDPSFYQPKTSLTCDKDPQHLECLNRGRWLARSLKIGGSDIPSPTTQTFTYTGGVSDKRGRGFLGFIQRDVYGPGSRHETITYDPISRIEKSATTSLKPYAYPYALLPATDRLDVDTPQGPNSHHYETTTSGLTAYWESNGALFIHPSVIAYQHYDCPTTSGSTCSGTARLLLSRNQFPTFDGYGNVTKMQVGYYNSSGQLIRTDTDVINYQAPDQQNWLVSLVDPTRPSTRSSSLTPPAPQAPPPPAPQPPPPPPVTVTRTVKFTPDPTSGGIATVEIEPQGDATTHLTRTFGRDGRGRLTSIREQEVATGTNRTTEASFDNIDGFYDSDGVYATLIRRDSGVVVHNQRIWRHPGYGFVVEVDDPNGIASTRSYDTFGRVLSQTAPSGALTTFQYLETPNTGVNLAIYPEDKSTRMIKAHLDSWGRETSRTSPVDASRAVEEDLDYDTFGRVQTTTEKSVGSATTVLNTYSFTYDDLDRLLSDCHLAFDGQSHCSTSTFDGRSVVKTDEAGRAVTHTVDDLGRPALQDASLAPASSSASFIYGPFDVLKQEKTSDGSGQTDIAYDVLGRTISLTRTGTGIRRTTYNAFGEVVGTSKQNADGSQVESLIYRRDYLGRLTSITNPAGTSYGVFTWDAPAASPSTPAPYAIGKLVDVTGGTGGAQIHYDYGSNGLVRTKAWTTQVFAPPSSVGSEQFTYDSQGRLSTITYPSYAWSSPLALTYAYDPSTGDEASVTDNTNPSAPTTIWSVGARSERGQIKSESMKMSGGPTVARTTNHNLQNGMPADMTLSGSNGQSKLTYTYDADNLPTTLGMSGIGTWTSTFGHDNLGRMTTWTPSTLDLTVTFTYDGDGNLTQRSWSGETVNYGSTPTARTVTVSQGGVTVANDTYQVDPWGRILDTPTATFAYDALDRITGITEKSTGRFDFFRLDGFGNRVMTAYGTPFNGQGYSLLFTLDDLYEFRYSSSTGSEERCRVRAGGKLVGELVRTSDTPTRTATFFLTDNVGSVVAEASSAGTVTQRARRDPFGNKFKNAPNLPADLTAADPDGSGRMGYGDHPRDTSWGVIDMVSRFYSPRLGRFISPDKILPNAFDRREHNAFAYVRNTPAALQDPFGFCGEPEGEACPMPPVLPGGGGGVPGPGKRDQDPYPPCGAEMCADTSKEIKQTYVNTVVNKINGAATASATSPNATNTAGVNRSHGATGGWGDEWFGPYDVSKPLTQDEREEVSKWIWDNSTLLLGPDNWVDNYRTFRLIQAEAQWKAGNYGTWLGNRILGGLYGGEYNSIGSLRVPGVGLRPPTSLGGAGRGTGFVVTPQGDVITIPTGATGPVPNLNPAGRVTGTGYTGGRGGPGFDARVSNVRIMEPTPPRGPSPGYPNGYVNYQNASGQTVDPSTGRTLAPSDPLWHIPLR